ncbi:hypothetical protein H8E52_07920 [bacterium]|nr:hypothetical protein [bacterium]
MAGEFCGHAEDFHTAKAQTDGVCFEAADDPCCDHEACEHDSCSCHCLCHVPAASPQALLAENLLPSSGKVADAEKASPRNLSQPQERPPIVA